MRLLPIEHCWECTWTALDDDRTNHCTHGDAPDGDAIIENIGIIPDWCPLERDGLRERVTALLETYRWREQTVMMSQQEIEGVRMIIEELEAAIDPPIDSATP